jgi:hypothetical protein
VLVIADNVPLGFKSLDDVQKQEIRLRENELMIRYEDDATNQPILRKCTKEAGVLDALMPNSATLAIYESTPEKAD